MATYSSSGVGVMRFVLRRDVLLLLRHWCHASCVATYPSSSRVGDTTCVATYSSSSSSSGVGVTRLVLRRTPPPPALVSRDLCCDVLLLRRWCHATGVATYPFSHVKSKRLLPLVGNPRHETQSIVRVFMSSLRRHGASVCVKGKRVSLSSIHTEI